MCWLPKIRNLELWFCFVISWNEELVLGTRAVMDPALESAPESFFGSFTWKFKVIPTPIHPGRSHRSRFQLWSRHQGWCRLQQLSRLQPCLLGAMYINVMFVLHTSMKSALSCLSHAFSSFLSGADLTKEPFPAMDPNPKVVPIPGMVPAPIMVPAPAWNRLQLRLFESNSDSDSGIGNYRNHNSSSADISAVYHLFDPFIT